MVKIILAIILLLFSIAAFIISFRSFREKGSLFNNAYLFASKRERDGMNKTPYYRQTAIVFLLLGTIFLLNAASVIFSIIWLSFLAIVTVVIMVIYAVVSAIVIERKNK